MTYRFYKSIEDAYSHANRTLLNMLLQDQQLLSRLRSLKRFFFMSQSFFITHLLDQAQSELRKSSKTASVLKLQSLLDLALNTDLHGEDMMFREDVKVKMANNGLYDWLLKIISEKGAIAGEVGEGGIPESAHGEGRRNKDEKPLMGKFPRAIPWCLRLLTMVVAIDALMLDYQVEFPLSLVISRKTILQYQLLFRFLLHLKHAEQTLSSMWIEQKTPPWRTSVPHHPEFEKWRLRVFLLRARMLAFVQQILAFVTFEVLEPNWRNLEVKLAKVTTVDQLLRDHSDFLDTCLKESMLTSARLLSVRLLSPFHPLIITERLYGFPGLLTYDHNVFHIRGIFGQVYRISDEGRRRGRLSRW
jgi:gamma-tubulin complex component 2